jgi:hypothetical protein
MASTVEEIIFANNFLFHFYKIKFTAFKCMVGEIDTEVVQECPAGTTQCLVADCPS